MAIESQNPRPGLLHHSDRGSQSTAEAYQQLRVTHGMRCSMSLKGDCLDNALTESAPQRVFQMFFRIERRAA